MLVTVTAFLVSGISVGRVVAFIAAAGALSLSSGLVLDKRLRQFTLAPVWRRVPLAS